jgi:hypothetical protein
MARSQSSQYFLERYGLMPTFRAPAPILQAVRSLVHSESVPAPLPAEEVIVAGEPAPDRVTTQDPWPHGNCPEEDA